MLTGIGDDVTVNSWLELICVISDKFVCDIRESFEADCAHTAKITASAANTS
jgi:hypothetical protein